jgi:hypothetical protein
MVLTAMYAGLSLSVGRLLACTLVLVSFIIWLMGKEG